MIKIKFKKNYKDNKKGDTISVSNNEAFGLIDIGVASKTTSFTSAPATTYVDKVLIGEEKKTYKTKRKVNEWQ